MTAGDSIEVVMFDLDGTLVQTLEASWLLFQETNRRFDLGIDSADEFYALSRTNIWEALQDRCEDASKARDAIAHFSELLSDRYTPELVPGITDVIRQLASHFTLVLLSANTMPAVRRILTLNGLAHCFAHVFTGDVEPSKLEAMRRFLSDPAYARARRCTPMYDENDGPKGAEASSTVLVTDTVGDILEAKKAGIRTLAVVWGMHSEEDLREAGADFIAIWPQEIVAALMPFAQGDGGTCAIPTSPAQSATTPHRTDEPSKTDPWDLASAASERRRVRRQQATKLMDRRCQTAMAAEPSTCCCEQQSAQALASDGDQALLEILTRLASATPSRPVADTLRVGAPSGRRRVA